MRGSKAVVMLELWASVKRAARDRPPRAGEAAGAGPAEPKGRPGAAPRPSARAAAS